MTIQSHLTLAGGTRIPAIGLGTWQSKPGEVGQAVRTALDVGYRHIDCAWVYRNEAEIGAAIQQSGVSRKDLFLTSKLWNRQAMLCFHSPQHVERTLDSTLEALQTDYIDLYLIHWPVAFGVPSDGKPRGYPKGPDGKVVIDRELTRNVLPTWRAMEALVDKKKIKNIGISNFSIGRCEELLKHARIKPAVNQVEVNWLWPQHHLIDSCAAHNITVEAYSPLGSNQSATYLADPTVGRVARECGVEPAQVIISWLRKRGLVVLVKSVKPSRIESNLYPLDLPDDLFTYLQRRSRSTSGHRGLDPSKEWGIIPSIYEDVPYTKL